MGVSPVLAETNLREQRLWPSSYLHYQRRGRDARATAGETPALQLGGWRNAKSAQVQASKNSRICFQYFRTIKSVLKCPPRRNRFSFAPLVHTNFTTER